MTERRLLSHSFILLTRGLTEYDSGVRIRGLVVVEYQISALIVIELFKINIFALLFLFLNFLLYQIQIVIHLSRGRRQYIFLDFFALRSMDLKVTLMMIDELVLGSSHCILTNIIASVGGVLAGGCRRRLVKGIRQGHIHVRVSDITRVILQEVYRNRLIIL